MFVSTIRPTMAVIVADGFLSPQYVAVFSEEKPHDIAAEARIYPVTAPDGSRFTCLLPSVDQTAPIQSHDTSLPVSPLGAQIAAQSGSVLPSPPVCAHAC